MRIASLVLLVLCFTGSRAVIAEPTSKGYGYSFESTLLLAVENDPWLKKSQYQEKSLLSEGVAEASLPDPKASVSVANLPIDDFSSSSQPMTQFKLGLSQTFARGDSLELKGDIKRLEASIQPYLRENRKTQLMMQVGSIWLDAYKSQQSIELISNKKKLLQELKEFVEINYQTAIQSKSQQDLIRAELELIKLDDQINLYEDKLHNSIRKLSEYIPLPQSYISGYNDSVKNSSSENSNSEKINYFSSDLPRITLLDKQSAVQKHPLVTAIAQNIASSEKRVDLNKQGYKPQFTVNGSYAFRNDAPNGEQRPDFFSIGVSFDMPLFTESKQDKAIEAAVYTKESYREERALMINKLMAGYDTQMSRFDHLHKRLKLYREKIFPQIQQYEKASKTAYSNNESDFSDLIGARVDDINAQLTVLELTVELEKSKLKANYYQAESSKELLAHISTKSSLNIFSIKSGDDHE